MIKEIYLDDVAGRLRGVVLKKTPRMVSAGMRGDFVDVPGRDGAAWVSDGGLEGVEVTAGLYVYEDVSLDDVLRWIRKAKSVRWGHNAWEYRVEPAALSLEVEPWEDFDGEAGWEIEVKWQAEPYRYVWPEVGAIHVEAAAGGTIQNNCTAASEPLILVRGTGAGVVQIGDFAATISAIPADGILLDSRRRMAYSPDGLTMETGLVSLAVTAAGRWPLLQPGANRVTLSGGVDHVEVTPRFRWR